MTTENAEQLAAVKEEAEQNSAGTLTVTLSRGQNMYGNDRLSYNFTTTDIQKDWGTIKTYAARFDKVIDTEITKRIELKNNAPGRKPGRPKKVLVPVSTEETIAPPA